MLSKIIDESDHFLGFMIFFVIPFIIIFYFCDKFFSRKKASDKDKASGETGYFPIIRGGVCQPLFPTECVRCGNDAKKRVDHESNWAFDIGRHSRYDVGKVMKGSNNFGGLIIGNIRDTTGRRRWSTIVKFELRVPYCKDCYSTNAIDNFAKGSFHKQWVGGAKAGFFARLKQERKSLDFNDNGSARKFLKAEFEFVNSYIENKFYELNGQARTSQSGIITIRTIKKCRLCLEEYDAKEIHCPFCGEGIQSINERIYYVYDNYKRSIEACDNNAAINCLNNVIKLDPSNINYYINRADLFFEIWNMEKAIDDYSKCIELSPNNDIAYYYRSLAYARIGKKDESDSDMKEAAQLGNKKANEYYL